MGKSKTYYGWKNYETWNVALWLNNEGLVDYFNSEEELKYIRSYRAYINYLNLDGQKTGDGVNYLHYSLDYKALTEMLLEARKA